MPPRKKVKNAASEAGEASTLKTAIAKPKRVRGSRGSLKNMSSMPLDVLLEIFCFLHPRDLLNLARASKAFRALLMARQHARCWKRARAQLGDEYPEAPSYLSEPAYADLLFFHHCYNCSKKNIRTVYWKFAARYCKPCFEVMTCLYPEELHKEVHATLPGLSDQPFLNWEWVEPRTGPRRQERMAHKPDVKMFEKKWRELTSLPDKRRFVEERQAFAEEAREYHYQLHGLSEKARLENRKGAKVSREARLNAVEDKLRADGWGDELQFMKAQKKYQEVTHHKGVFKQSELTDEEWAEMRDEVIAIVRPYREALRQSKERKKLFETRLQHLQTAYNDHLRAGGSLTRRYTPADEQKPTFCDLAYLPEVRKLVEADPNDPISVDTFSPLIQDCMDKWTQERKQRFEEKARRILNRNPVAQGPGVLDLAIIFFKCTVEECQWATPIRWPEVLAHPCLRPMPYSRVDGLKDDFDDVICRKFGRDHLMGDEKQTVFNKHSKEIREVISCCGENPNVVTFETMEECPVRLACSQCGEPNRRQVFDWRGAFTHWVDHHKSGFVRWERVTGADAAKVKELAEVLYKGWVKQAYAQPLSRLACAWCSKRDWYSDEDSYDEMIDHVQVCHDIEEPVVDVDLYMSVDLRARGAPPVWMFSAALADDPEAKREVEKGKGFFRT